MSQTQPSLRLPPREELVNAFEFEEASKLKLPAAVYAAIAGSDRAAFDRITFRPRMNVPTVDLDLSVELFGVKHFTPIIVGPVSDQRQYHPDGELATVRGAGAANTAVIVSSKSSVPIDQIAEASKTPLWYSVYTEAAAQKQIQSAIATGCKAICISRPSGNARLDWRIVDQLRAGSTVPILIKGIMTADDAKAAIQRGIQGIVVSNHGAGKPSPIETLSSISDIAGGKAAVLIDGSFRRGSDILKALALGAQGVLLARPVMWGLAAYGADGVQTVIELLQNDVARSMGMLGAPNLKALNRSMVKVHAPSRA